MEQEDKRTLRKRISTLRRMPGGVPSEAAAQVLWDMVEAESAFACARTVLLYSALPDEIPTDAFIRRWCGSRRIVLPVVCGTQLLLREYCPEYIRSGYCGVAEPTEECPEVAPEEVDFAVVPGVAFDMEGGRMGRGRGFYDRLLSALSCPTVSVAMPFQIVDRVPSDPWDRKVGKIIVCPSI